MPGGNTSTSKRGYRQIKGGGQKAPDVIALSGSETFGDERNMQLFSAPADAGYDIDTDYGLSTWNHDTPGNTEDTQGNGGWTAAPAPKAPTGNPGKPSRGADPTPGGGWD